MATLPLDLIREIVEIAAECSLSQAATLAPISREFNRCVRPMLCRTLMYYWTDSGSQWPVPVEELPQWLEVNGRHVRNLIWGISFNNDTRNLLSILKQCPGITNLALWVNASRGDISTILPGVSTLRLSRFSVNLHELFDRDVFSDREASYDAFRAVTHMDIIGDYTKWNQIRGLAHLPSLTHLSLPQRTHDPKYFNVIGPALEECKHLKVLALVAGTDLSDDLPLRAAQVPIVAGGGDYGDKIDLRLVAFDCDFAADWVYGATGRKDMWVLADEVVERRLKGEENTNEGAS
ncbi:hypothetical protein BDN72DRAFT_845778 [Pluteus cervinus]|uniref:Uncharacterized protein n=1 Tax=Pluteus cervinus TaxID=181527 RepID=A0ACD3AI24_9AGAR|nr:hypothetical protein BDN72DRAFT_845778 [Pluteus cervinus]